MVAKGACDLYVEMGLHAWDMAAGNVIVKEAGGVIVDPAGIFIFGSFKFKNLFVKFVYRL